MASPNQDMGPLTALLNLVDQTSIAIWVVIIAPVLAFIRWALSVRKRDLERIADAENEIDLAKRDIASLNNAQSEIKSYIREYQIALSNKPDRKEVFDRIDAIPAQVAMLLDRRRD